MNCQQGLRSDSTLDALVKGSPMPSLAGTLISLPSELYVVKSETQRARSSSEALFFGWCRASKLEYRSTVNQRDNNLLTEELQPDGK